MYRTLALALLLVGIFLSGRVLSTESDTEEWERPMTLTESFGGPGCNCLTEKQLSAIPTTILSKKFNREKLTEDDTRTIFKSFKKGLKVYLKNEDVKTRLRFSAWTPEMITENNIMEPLISTDIVEPITLLSVEAALREGDKYSAERIEITQIVKEGLRQIADEQTNHNGRVKLMAVVHKYINIINGQ